MEAAPLPLPPPRKTETKSANKKSAQKAPQTLTPSTTTRRAPSYEERCQAAAEFASLSPEQRRQRPPLFVPRSLQDFDDGGAFPEIHVAQYPRHMANPQLKKNVNSQSMVLKNVQVDVNGQISYDSIVKGGTNADKLVYSQHQHLKPISSAKADTDLPTPEEEKAEAERTQAALQALVVQHTAFDKPSGSAMMNAETSKNMEQKTQFVKYSARPEAPGFNPAAAQRVVQVVPAQVDPMMPPKHKHIKAPKGPAEDPVPVLHAPPTKLTKEEREAWNIPASISNWKNARGYTIPLDKRLAADGRGLQEHTINPKFATLSESLYVAERQARQEVRLRAQVQQQLALQEKERREEELRQLAQQARQERGGAFTATQEHVSASASEDEHTASGPEDDDEDVVAARQREQLRKERKRERERELRLEQSMQAKRKKLEEERDVSEKIALGVHTGSGALAGEADSRLYNQSAGLDSGFGAEDEYNAFSKPLFDRQGVTSSSIYRPTRGETENTADEQYDKLVQGATSKFQPDRGFAGAEGGMAAGPRIAPVQFEKGKPT